MTARALAAVALAVLALPLAGCGTGSSNEAAPGANAERDVQLSDLTSVEALRTLFNEDRGTPRLLLLLSPT